MERNRKGLDKKKGGESNGVEVKDEKDSGNGITKGKASKLWRKGKKGITKGKACKLRRKSKQGSDVT